MTRLVLAALLSLAATSIAFDYLLPEVSLQPWHAAYVSFEGSEPGQSRLLSYLVPEILVLLGAGVHASYMTVHWIVFLAALWTLGRGLERVLGREISWSEEIAVTSLFALAYSFGQERVLQPVDVWTFLFAAMLLRALFAPSRRGLKVALTLAGSALAKGNAFLYAPLLLVQLWRERGLGKGLPPFLAAFLPGAALFWVIRTVIDAPSHLRNEALANVGWVLHAFLAPAQALERNPFDSASWAGEIYWLVLFGSVWFLCGGLWKHLESRYRELLLVTVIALVANLIFGISRELRIFVASFAFVLPAVFRSLEILSIDRDTKPFSPAAGIALCAVLTTMTLATTAIIGSLLPAPPPAGLYPAESYGEITFHWVDRSASVALDSGSSSFRLRSAGRKIHSGEKIEIVITHEWQSGRRSRDIVAVGGDWVDISLPSDPAGRDRVKTIELETGHVFIPAVEGSPDRRRLSFMVSGL